MTHLLAKTAPSPEHTKYPNPAGVAVSLLHPLDWFPARGSLPGALRLQPPLFEGSGKGLNSRFRRLELTLAHPVAGHLRVEIFHPKKLILAYLEKSLDLFDRETHIDGLHKQFYHHV